MSNRRKPAIRNRYRTGFLQSPAWFARRERWFRREQRMPQPLVCAACGRLATAAQLELHHLDYRGVLLVEGRWRAMERHEDLLPMHPYCHDLLHRLIDRDAVLAKHRSRQAASMQALRRLRVKLVARERPR